jgi:hypothetical protein
MLGRLSLPLHISSAEVSACINSSCHPNLLLFLVSVSLFQSSIVHFCFSWATAGRVLEPAQICDLLKGIVLIVCCLLLNYIDVSMMYHLVRGQAIIKLYIFFNMLEVAALEAARMIHQLVCLFQVADRLFSSFGQDILDSLFWTATEPRGRKREHIGVLPHLVLAIFYVCIFDGKIASHKFTGLKSE